MRNSKEFRMLPLHKALKIKRIANNHTQYTLSALLNIPQPTISQVESGRMAIPNEYISTVCEYLYGKEKRSLEKKHG